MKTGIARFLSSRPVQIVCRLILGGLFIYASLDKIAHPQAFADIIYQYRLVPDLFIHFMAVALPWLEMVTGIFLVIGIFPRTAAILLSSLLAVFMITLVVNAIRGFNFNCGCFTTSSEAGESNFIVDAFRDLLMLLPGLIIIFFHKPITPHPSASQ
jgi:uncharacterized membrane protein YphA (DoxX/SURF4 family)